MQTLQTSWQVIRYCNLFWTFHIKESLDDCHKATVPVCWSSQTSHPVKLCWVQGHNTWGQWSLTIPGSFQPTQVIKEKLGMTKTLVVTGQSNFEAAVGILPCVMTNSLAFLQPSKSSEPKLQQHLTGLSPARSQEHMSDSHTTFLSISRYRFRTSRETWPLSLSQDRSSHLPSCQIWKHLVHLHTRLESAGGSSISPGK